MSGFELVLLICAGVLAAAALGVVYRMIVGPTILDRALASDSLVTLVVMGMALYIAQSGAAWAGPVMLSLTGLAFIGTVTFARFVAREDTLASRPGIHPHEPETETAAHEAIHLGPRVVAEEGEEPQNRVPLAEAQLEELAEPQNRAPAVAAESGFGQESGAGDTGGFGEEGRSRWPEDPAEEAR